MANPIAVPGTVVPSGSLTTPGGAQGVQGPSAVSTDASNLAVLGSDSLIFVPKTVVASKTSGYTILASDTSKLFICSGGAFALTFPSAVTAGNGWSILVRNVYANSTAQGTVSLTAVSSQTFNGLASPFPILPGQECTVVSDGTNWVVFGLAHEVLLATIDITSATASQTIALPAYRYFDLTVLGAICSASDTLLELTASTDNGSTYGTSYSRGVVYDNAATTVAYVTGATDTVVYLTPGIGTSNPSRTGIIDLRLWPGSGTRMPSFRRVVGTLGDASARVDTQAASGYLNLTGVGPANYLKILPSTGTINEMHLTLMGVA